MMFSLSPKAIKLTCVLPLFLLAGCGDDKAKSTKIPSTNPKVQTPAPSRVITPKVALPTTPIPNSAEVSEEAKTLDRKEANKPQKIAKAKPQPKKPKPQKKVAKPNLKFDLIRHNFDTIQAGDIIDYKFEFTNTGKAPLVINTVRATCGCTQPSYPFVPIEPGETGFIGVTYNSVGKEGLQKPLVTVTSNASNEPIALMLTGFVEPKKKEKQEKKTSPIDTLIKN